jgi:hypothetical protein
MTQRWIKYLHEPTGYISIENARKRLGMSESQLYTLLEFEGIELVKYHHEAYFQEADMRQLEDPHELGDPNQLAWKAVSCDLEDPLHEIPLCSLENLKAMADAGVIPVDTVFRHQLKYKQVRYNGQDWEPLGIAAEEFMV